jgi:hypothetical protein
MSKPLAPSRQLALIERAIRVELLKRLPPKKSPNYERVHVPYQRG